MKGKKCIVRVVVQKVSKDTLLNYLKKSNDNSELSDSIGDKSQIFKDLTNN